MCVWACHGWSLKLAIKSLVSTWMSDHPDWYCCWVHVIHHHAMPCCVPLPLVERLVVWAYQRFLEWSKLIIRLGCVQSCLHDRCTKKNVCGLSEHAQPPYFYLPGMWSVRALYGCEGACRVATFSPCPNLWIFPGFFQRFETIFQVFFNVTPTCCWVIALQKYPQDGKSQ